MDRQTIYSCCETTGTHKETNTMKRNSGPARLALSAVTVLGLASQGAQPLKAQTLPHHGAASSPNTLWWITQNGTGKAAEFDMYNAASSSPALIGVNYGVGDGLQGISNSLSGVA